jgi:chaperonin GroES
VHPTPARPNPPTTPTRIQRRERTRAPKTKTATTVSIRPLGDRVLVQRTEAESKTAGGILLPESAQEKPKEGIVISTGEGKLLDDGKRSTFSVKKGDRVLFTSYAGTDVKLLGDEYLIMREDDILAILG